MDDQTVFTLPLRIYVEDTDAGGIVFYANYLKYFERARTEFIRASGYEWRFGLEQNISYVVHSLDIKYLKSAKLDDMVGVNVRVNKLARTYIDFHQEVLNQQGEILVKANIKVACVHLDTAKPRVLPPELSKKIREKLSDRLREKIS